MLLMIYIFPFRADRPLICMICTIYLAHVAGWEPYGPYDHVFNGLNLYFTDPAQHLITAADELLKYHLL